MTSPMESRPDSFGAANALPARQKIFFVGVEDIEFIYRPHPEKRITKIRKRKSKELSILPGPAYNTVRFL